MELLYLLLPVFLPLAGGVVCWCIRRQEKLRDGFVLACAFVTLACAGLLVFSQGAAVSLGGWCGLGLHFSDVTAP